MPERKKVPRKTDRIYRVILLIVVDILSVFAAFFVGLWLRFDFSIGAIPRMYIWNCLGFSTVWCLISVAVFAFFGLYHSIWRFASVDEFIRIMGAYLVLGVGSLLYILLSNHAMPYSFYILGYVFSFLCTVAVRFFYSLAVRVKRIL